MVSKKFQLEFKAILNLYANILNDCSNNILSNEMCFGELDLWYQSCGYQNSITNNKRSLLDMYFQYDSQKIPVISKLLQILMTFPVIIATGKR